MAQTLLERARMLAADAAPAVLALAIAPLAETAAATTITSADLQLSYTGAYWYNASGYFEQPARYVDNTSGDLIDLANPSATVGSGTNAFGGPKLFGSIAATSQDFLTLNYPSNGYKSYYDAGFGMVWGGRLAAGLTPEVGDALALHYDFTVGLAALAGADNIAANYRLSATFGSYDRGSDNSTYGDLLVYGGITTAGSTRFVGNVLTSGLYDVSGPGYFWRVTLTVDGYSYPGYYDTTAGQYFNFTPGLSLTVPNQSLDVAFAPGGIAPAPIDVPEPASALLLGGALLAFARLRRQPTG